MIFLGWFNSARKEERLQEWCSSEKFWNSSCDLVSCGQLNVCFTRQWKARCFCTGKEAAFAGVIRGISFLKHLLPYTIFTRPLPVLHIVTQSQSPPRRQGLEIATYKKKSHLLSRELLLGKKPPLFFQGEKLGGGRWTINMVMNKWTFEIWIQCKHEKNIELSPLLWVSWSRCRVPRNAGCIATSLSSHSQPPRRHHHNRRHHRHLHNQHHTGPFVSFLYITQ